MLSTQKMRMHKKKSQKDALAQENMLLHKKRCVSTKKKKFFRKKVDCTNVAYTKDEDILCPAGRHLGVTANMSRDRLALARVSHLPL